MGIIQKDAFRTMLLSYAGVGLGYLNKGILFVIILSPFEIGLVNLIITIGLLFAQGANLGTIYTTWKFLPFFKNREKNHYGFLPLMLLIVTAGVVLCLTILLVFRRQILEGYREHSAEFVHYYYWVIPVGVGYVLFTLLESYLRGFYKNIISVFSHEIILRVLCTLTIVLYALQAISFELFVYLNALVYLIPPTILFVYLARSGELLIAPSMVRISKRFRKIIFRYSRFNYINSLGSVVITSLDVIMISQMRGLDATGVYSTIVFLASFIQVPYRSIIRISAPLVADYWKHREMDKMKELYTKVSSVSLLIALSFFVYIWLNIDFIFSFLKPEFQPGIWVFFFLMLGRMLDMYFGLNGSIFSTSKKYRYDILFTVFLIVAVYLLNLLLIPRIGMAGAAISTGSALVIYNIGRVLFVWKVYKIHPFEPNQFIVIGLAVVTIVVGQYVGHSIENGWWRLLIQTALFGGLFLLPIYLFRLEKESINFVRNGISFLTTTLVKKNIQR